MNMNIVRCALLIQGKDWLSQLPSLSDAARQYGPFFFSLFLLGGVTVWAQRWYSALIKRTNPPATKTDRIVYASILLPSFGVGLALVIFSVNWWAKYNPNTYLFRGVFKNLHTYEQIDSDGEIFFHTITKNPMGKGDLIHNVQFMAVQNTPFRPGQIVSIDFSKGDGEAQTLQFIYDKDEAEPAYTIDFDPQTGKNSIKLQPSSSVKAGYFLAPTTVYAATWGEEEQKAQSQRSEPFSQMKMIPSDSPLQFIEPLQNPRSDVGMKIRMVEKLASKESGERDKILSLTTDYEPVLVTLLDLTRHSDRELAYRTIHLLEAFDSDSFVVKSLRASDADIRRAAETSFFHMERPQAERVLGMLQTRQDQVSGNTLQTLRQGIGSLLLRPTGSPQGDRYYVRATWNPNEENVSQCLTKLFNSELYSNRSIAKESDLMKNRGSRLVYWYSKEWAISIAKGITGCGGRAQYVTSDQ
ncbi:MAG TPA: hypothetical protein VKB48_18875 [Candidatus Acidoferrum sp.]|nr:hypothetical protein [Candidatus Acidoferrum sp.]